jgi:hypothetical protein
VQSFSEYIRLGTRVSESAVRARLARFSPHVEHKFHYKVRLPVEFTLDNLISVLDMELWFDGLIEDKRNLSND